MQKIIDQSISRASKTTQKSLATSEFSARQQGAKSLGDKIHEM